MRTYIALPLIGIASLAYACGGDSGSANKAGAGTVNDAISEPNAQIDTTTTAAAVQSSVEGASAAGGAPGVPSFGFAAPAALRGAFALPGDFHAFMGNATGAGSSLKDQFAQTCQSQEKASADIDASDISQGSTGGCTYSGSLHYEYQCSNNNSAIKWKFKYNNFAATCTASTNDTSFKVNGSGEILMGLSKDETKWGIRAFYDMSGSFGSGATSNEFAYNGGGALVYDANDFSKVLLMAIVVGVKQDGDTNYVVFYSGDKSNPTLSREGLLNRAVAVKGANGTFLAWCEKSETVKCALWKDGSLVSSDITPTPALPTTTPVELDLTNMLE